LPFSSTVPVPLEETDIEFFLFFEKMSQIPVIRIAPKTMITNQEKKNQTTDTIKKMSLF